MRARVRARTHTGARHCLRHHGPARLRKARDDVDGLRHLHHLRHTHARASVHIRRADGTGGKNRGTRRAHQTSLSCFTTSMPSSAAAGSVRTSAAQHAGQRGRGQRKHKANTNIQHHVHLPVAIAKTYLKSLNVLLPTSTMRPRKKKETFDYKKWVLHRCVLQLLEGPPDGAPCLRLARRDPRQVSRLRAGTA